MNIGTRRLAAIASLALSANHALAQSPTITPLLRTGDVVSGSGSTPVRSIRSITANDLKGVAATVLLGDGSTIAGREQPAIWSGNSGVQLVAKLTTSAPVFPGPIDCGIGMASNGNVVSSSLLARSTFLGGTLPVAGFVDSLWIGGMPAIIQGQGAGLDGNGNAQYYGAIRNVGIIGEGRAYGIVDLTTAPFGDSVTTGLVLENGGLWEWQLLGGDVVSGTTQPVLQADGIVSVAMSTNGGKYAAIARLGGTPEASQLGLVVNGILFSTGSGRRAIVGNLLPGSSNTTEHWSKLYLPAVNEATTTAKKSVMCAGESDRPGDDRYVILRNASILARSGSVVGSETLRGPVQFLATNMSADYLAVWGIRTGAEQAVVLNGSVLLKTGDTVPIDATTNGVLGRIPTPSGVAMGAKTLDGHLKVYVLASVQPASGEPRDVVLEIDKVVGSVVVCPVDWNADNILSVQDIFDFLNDWFATCGQPGSACTSPNADFNADSVLDVQDVFDFLNAWFAGC